MDFKETFIPMADFSQSVTLYHTNSASQVFIKEAVFTRLGKSDSGFLSSHPVPHIKAVWYLPITSTVMDIKCYDRLCDCNSRKWIIMDINSLYDLHVFRCRAVMETLSPSANDVVDIFRLDTRFKKISTNAQATTIFTQISCLPKTCSTKVFSKTYEPSRKTQSTHEWFLPKDKAVQVFDILARDNKYYEVLSCEAIPGSDWQIIRSLLIEENQQNWKVPNF